LLHKAGVPSMASLYGHVDWLVRAQTTSSVEPTMSSNCEHARKYLWMAVVDQQTQDGCPDLYFHISRKTWKS
jgi:hypothetical protein